ncbi:hypothetical protein TR51_25655 [Kitasatospora griseola]|uniref:Uncharacterized protein n=1 Tax=Kitasatospora griseola TaxID=2064 RepID=A0A0D0N2X4_KITGR|nr:hypothetical protein [Kitasatospora griseola]KIQ62425.1 hypothetical protein TR51_25655 [Kitasatospora griseola]
MASIIRPEDFNPNTADPLRWRWSRDQMSAVIRALAGQPVYIELDRGTGYTWQAELLDCGHDTVTVRLDETPNRRIAYHLFKVGVIMDARPQASFKWEALRIFREEEHERKIARAARKVEFEAAMAARRARQEAAWKRA